MLKIEIGMVTASTMIQAMTSHEKQLAIRGQYPRQASSSRRLALRASMDSSHSLCNVRVLARALDAMALAMHETASTAMAMASSVVISKDSRGVVATEEGGLVEMGAP